MKRFLAILGIIILAGMYLATLIFVLIGTEFAFTMFKISLVCSIIIPCLLYAMILAFKFLNRKK